MEASDRFRIAPDVAFRQVGGEFVLMDLERGTYFGLNAVGSRIWQLLIEEPRSLAELCARIIDEFDVATEVVQRDLALLVEELLEKTLLIPEKSGD